MAQVQTKVDWHTGLRLPEYIEGQSAVDDLNGSDKVDFYDKYAEAYDHDMMAYRMTSYQQAAATLHRYLRGNEDSKILDVGAGTGLVMRELQKLAPYKNAHGLDPSAGMLNVAKKDGLYGEVFVQYFNINSGVEHNSYDIVTCCAAMAPGHIEPEGIIEMSDIAKPGGYVILVARQCYFEQYATFQRLFPIVQQMVDEKKVSLIEETKFDNYYPGYDGFIIVLQKL